MKDEGINFLHVCLPRIDLLCAYTPGALLDASHVFADMAENLRQAVAGQARGNGSFYDEARVKAPSLFCSKARTVHARHPTSDVTAPPP